MKSDINDTMEKRVKNLLKIASLFLISLIPLGLILGCSSSGEGCKIDFTNCVSSKDYDFDENVNASSCSVKSCNGCWGCDSCSSCIWSKEIDALSIESKAENNEMSVKGCVNYYQSEQGCGGVKSEHQALIYFSDKDNTFAGCESTSCPNCSCGCLNGCFFCGSNQDLADDYIDDAIKNIPED